MPITRLLPLSLLSLPLLLGASALAHGAVATVIGTAPGYSGDGGPAAAAQLQNPRAIALLPGGDLVIADSGNYRVRRVTAGGTIVTAAGTGAPAGGPPGGGEGMPGPSVALGQVTDVAADAHGGVVIADGGAHRIRRIAPDGTLRTVAGSSLGLWGDGGAATAAGLNAPGGVAVLGDGGLLIADTGNNRIRRVAPDGVITTVAGTGPGFAGDGGPATAARLNGPRAVVPLAEGGYLIADSGNQRIRRVDAHGVISTVSGGGVGFDGAGGPPAAAALAEPVDLLPLANGGVLIADAGSDSLRRVTPLGAVVAVAGGRRALAGDGGPTAGGRFDTPSGLATGPQGQILIADTGNSRVRQITDLGALPAPEPLRTIGVEPLAGTVGVRPRGRAAQVVLREPDLTPNVSVVDANRGRVRLRVQLLDRPGDAVAEVGGSRFTLVQPVAEPAVADLRLTEPLTCGRRAQGTTQEHQTRRRTQRRIRVKVRGRYRTTGRFATAVANGTTWTITDRCDRTIIRVSAGSVTVRDLRTNRNIRVRAGKSYVALNRPARARR